MASVRRRDLVVGRALASVDSMERTRSPWWLIAAQVRPEGGRLRVLVGLLLAATALPLAGPLLVRAFVDQAIAGRALGHLVVLAGAYLGVAAGGQVATVVSTYLASGVAWRTANRLREMAAEHSLGLDMGYHARHSPGEMIERVDGDLLGLSEFLSGFVAQALGGALLLIGTLAVVWWTNLLAGTTLTALVLVGGLVAGRAQRRVVPWPPSSARPPPRCSVLSRRLS